MDLFSTDELYDFSDLLPSKVHQQARTSNTLDAAAGEEEEHTRGKDEEIREVEGSTEQYQQTALSKMNEFFN